MFSRFDSITLDDMNAEARMMTRVDRKYLLHTDELRAFLDEVPADTRVLEINGKRQQRYVTTYFDTPDLLSYRMTAQTRRHRFKVRQRTYVDSNLGFCEVKTRGPRGVTVKHRVPIAPAYAHSGRLAPEALDFLDAELNPQLVGQLSPSVHNTYLRATLRPSGVGRATIDTALTWRSERSNQRLENCDVVFIETKSGARPSPLDKILWGLGHRPTRVSKFGTGMATMHPELPSNKWNRVINNYFKDTL